MEDEKRLKRRVTPDIDSRGTKAGFDESIRPSIPSDHIEDSLSADGLSHVDSEPAAAAAAASAAATTRPETVMSLLKQGQTREDSFDKDIELWHRTITQRGDLTDDEAQVLDEQQGILKRHFTAMALLGLQGGNQDTGVYSPSGQPWPQHLRVVSVQPKSSVHS